MPEESAFGSKDNEITTTHGPGKKKPKHVDKNVRTDPTDLRRGILMDLVRTVKGRKIHDIHDLLSSLVVSFLLFHCFITEIVTLLVYANCTLVCWCSSHVM